MKRFVLFFGATYYPSQGLGDYVNSFDTLDEAKAKAYEIFERHDAYSWAQIADFEEMTVVFECDAEDRNKPECLAKFKPYLIEATFYAD